MGEVWQQIVASCSGALVTAVFMTPLDVVKIRLQAQTKGFVKGECFLYCNGLMDHVCTCLNGASAKGKLWGKIPNTQLNGMLGKCFRTRQPIADQEWCCLNGYHTFENPAYRPIKPCMKGMVDAFIKIPQMEGIASLWSGLPPTLVMAVPSTVIYFTMYDQLKIAFDFQEGSRNSLYIPFTCGALARAGSVTVITPLELIRTKMQSQSMTYRETGRAVKDAFNNGGVFSLWRGWGPLMWRDVPFSAVYFLIYESMKSVALQSDSKEKITTLQSFAFGATSGMIAGVATLPMDVVKTRRQVELGTIAALKGNTAPRGTFYILRDLYHKHGLRSWFTGLGPRILKVSPACAIMISSYEYFKELFGSDSYEPS